MTKKKKYISPAQHIKACEKIYEKDGQGAVYDYANKHKIKDWRYCKGCEAMTPVVKDTCLVCGGGSFEVENTKPINFVVETEQDGCMIFEVLTSKDPNYPQVEVKINKQTVVVVEYESSNRTIRTMHYPPGPDNQDSEPCQFVTFKNLKQ